MRSAKGVRIRKRTIEESSNSGSAAHLIAGNDNLLLELLLRLPIKSLLKFKCVSKHWLSLITDPLFTHRKSLKSKSVLYLFCQSKVYRSHCGFVPLYPLLSRAQFLSLSFADKDHEVRVWQSCNGLLCCYLFRNHKPTYCIYNPTTKQFRTLPPPQDHLASNMSVAAVNLAFDPSKSHAYKVVCIGKHAGFASPCQILIYSSETGQWRVSGAPFCPTVYSDFWNGVYWNGAIHWMSENGYRTSLYFDLNEELVQEMPMPHPSGSYEWIVMFFGESNGHLHLVEGHRSNQGRQLDVYEMERDHSGWFVKFQVDLDGVALDFYGRENWYTYCLSVLGVVRGEQEEDSFLVLYLYGIIFRYNLKGHAHRVMCDTWAPRFRFRVQTDEVIYTDTSRYNIRRQTRKVTYFNLNRRVCGWPNAFQIIESLSDV